jgi:hypothetical protein
MSHEVQDILVNLDRRSVCCSTSSIASSAPAITWSVSAPDHGVAPIPELLKAQRFDAATASTPFGRALDAVLARELGPGRTGPAC